MTDRSEEKPAPGPARETPVAPQGMGARRRWLPIAAAVVAGGGRIGRGIRLCGRRAQCG